MRVLGIDPGIDGGWAVLSGSGALISAGDLPVAGDASHRMVSAPLLAATIGDHAVDRAVVENVGSMRGQGISSTFKFGRALGTIDGVLGALGIPIERPTPSKWKRHFGLGTDKEASRQLAIQKWPASAATLFKRKADHQRAEAALIALYSIETSRIPAEAA